MTLDEDLKKPIRHYESYFTEGEIQQIKLEAINLNEVYEARLIKVYRTRFGEKKD